MDDQIAVSGHASRISTTSYCVSVCDGFSLPPSPLSNRILNEGAPAVTDYLGFLSGGSSKPPIGASRGAGVDMTTSEPTAAALAYFDELIDELADALR